MNRPKSQTKKTNAWEIGSFCFSLILLLLFINIIERDPDSFDDKCGKGTVFAFDSLFHLGYLYGLAHIHLDHRSACEVYTVVETSCHSADESDYHDQYRNTVVYLSVFDEMKILMYRE